MSGASDKQRIIALQKALRIARAALERAQYDCTGNFVEDALDEINKLDWNSKPDLDPGSEASMTAPTSAEAVAGLVREMREGLKGVTPGPWTHCTGGCQCAAILAADHPVAEVTKGDWGDDYPSLRFKEGGEGHIVSSIEPYIAQITYGNVPTEVAMANRAHIARCSPDNIAKLLDALTSLAAEVETQKELKKHARRYCDEAEARADFLAAELAQCREALRPFAKIASEYSPREDDGFDIMGDKDVLGEKLTLRKFRRARTALKGASHEPG